MEQRHPTTKASLRMGTHHQTNPTVKPNVLVLLWCCLAITEMLTQSQACIVIGKPKQAPTWVIAGYLQLEQGNQPRHVTKEKGHYGANVNKVRVKNRVEI